MEAKRNENGKINLYLCRELGSNMMKVAECNNLTELRKEGEKLLNQGAECANGFHAREYAFQKTDGNISFGW